MTEAGSPLARRAWRGHSAGVEAYVPSANKRYYMLMDHRGSAHAVLDESKAVVASRLYNAFGGVTFETGAWPGEVPFRYQSNWLHLCDLPDGSPLYLSPTRAYHAGVGRFLQRDFLRSGSELNPYIYAHESPLLLTDPAGLQPCMQELEQLKRAREDTDMMFGRQNDIESELATARQRWLLNLLAAREMNPEYPTYVLYRDRAVYYRQEVVRLEGRLAATQSLIPMHWQAEKEAQARLKACADREVEARIARCCCPGGAWSLSGAYGGGGSFLGGLGVVTWTAVCDGDRRITAVITTATISGGITAGAGAVLTGKGWVEGAPYVSDLKGTTFGASGGAGLWGIFGAGGSAEASFATPEKPGTGVYTGGAGFARGPEWLPVQAVLSGSYTWIRSVTGC